MDSPFVQRGDNRLGSTISNPIGCASPHQGLPTTRAAPGRECRQRSFPDLPIESPLNRSPNEREGLGQSGWRVSDFAFLPYCLIRARRLEMLEQPPVEGQR
jgi:hypothetical protein